MYELRMKAGSVAVFENPKAVVAQNYPYLDAKEKKTQPATLPAFIRSSPNDPRLSTTNRLRRSLSS